ncbi:type II toxin-antitoxin system RelE/ParE family toxin [Glaesserella parasuis]|uniref:type II toxin-antitoxin system RelE/ParE family toxin n=1 Tax=Glaesserella parasuis TaxID=738 RepID=UPI0024368988|nr:type II toxin-antitoxin system RelE/ParE family toxin [Glaesserella parasuis]MDG6817926.1 type II toxin-antitoxin system RelE/ParE family toxin [Glaesserella parasuis]MDP0013498.1 type II toxin-antitoxin system RelE/ParE family toxin [Glaesserella parasuis]MDP0045384.1 type II toxin-antitoxin system RelE/ParE family toxin [Glaesserella parasuis]MDP0136853.1 type II toxin-antitoxin system RelE/ParE family toxin [Glaesserella parasuis]MDP0138978.1 type II toxin-antitoxin system RelE/ParE fami
MYIIEQTETFKLWPNELKDPIAKIAIIRRLERAKNGHFGDHKSLGDGIYEMRLMINKGYRIYYARKGEIIYLIINGGYKDSQEQDIAVAKRFWQQYQLEQE